MSQIKLDCLDSLEVEVHEDDYFWYKAFITDVFEKEVSVAFPNEQDEWGYEFKWVRLPPSEHPRERNFRVGQEVEVTFGHNVDQKYWLRASIKSIKGDSYVVEVDKLIKVKKVGGYLHRVSAKKVRHRNTNPPIDANTFYKFEIEVPEDLREYACMKNDHNEFIKVIEAGVCRYMPEKGVLRVISRSERSRKLASMFQEMYLRNLLLLKEFEEAARQLESTKLQNTTGCNSNEVHGKDGEEGKELEYSATFKIDGEETLSGEELKAMLVKQMDIATCCVCLEPLRPTLVLCEGGHGVCQPCALKLDTCPICKQPFSPVKPILLTQLLETLPHECQHKGCSYFVRTGDNHEAWCGHIPAQCKKCDWIGDGESILAHVTEEHSSTHVFKEKNHCRLENFDPEEEISDIAPFYVYGQFLWGECSIDLKTQYLNLKYHLVRNGKVPGDINVVVQMKNSTMHNTYRMKLCFDKKIKAKDNTISIGLSALDGFVDNHNNLCYQVDFIQDG